MQPLSHLVASPGLSYGYTCLIINTSHVFFKRITVIYEALGSFGNNLVNRQKHYQSVRGPLSIHTP